MKKKKAKKSYTTINICHENIILKRPNLQTLKGVEMIQFKVEKDFCFVLTIEYIGINFNEQF